MILSGGIKMRYIIGLIMLLSASIVSANEIYIEQVGDTLDLDITQDGQNNKVGTSSQDVVLGSAKPMQIQ